MAFCTRFLLVLDCRVLPVMHLLGFTHSHSDGRDCTVLKLQGIVFTSQTQVLVFSVHSNSETATASFEHECLSLQRVVPIPTQPAIASDHGAPPTHIP